MMKIVNWILSFYPPHWRARYQEEMLALLDEYTITWKTVFDLLLGALDARLDPAYRSKEGIRLQPLHDIRLSAYIYITALAIFTVAINCWSLSVDNFGYLLSSLSDGGSPLIHIIPTGLAIAGPVLMIAICFTVLVINIVSIFKRAAGKRRIRLFVFALICLLLAGLTKVICFPAMALVPALITVLLPISMLLFTGGLKIFKLLRAHQFAALIFALLIGVIAPTGLVLYETLLYQTVFAISNVWSQAIPYFALGILVLLLADTPLNKRNLSMLRRTGMIMTTLIAVEAMVVVGWDISCWIAGNGSIPFFVGDQGILTALFAYDGSMILIINALILMGMLTLILTALIRASNIKTQPEQQKIAWAKLTF